MKCTTCNQVVHRNCDYNQGRCPHRKPMIEIQPKDTRKGHFYVSLVKSFLRIAAGVALCVYSLPIVGGLLIVAEVLGIVEELV
jgi:hypothetical protein